MTTFYLEPPHKLTPTEDTLLNRVLTNLTRIPDYCPGTYRVFSGDRSYDREIYAISRIRALAIGYLDHSEDGRIPLEAELIHADSNPRPVEDLISPVHDPVKPGSGFRKESLDSGIEPA